MLDLTPVFAALGTLGASFTAFFVLRRFVHWWRPILICPSISLVFGGSGPDQIGATITNVSSERPGIGSVQCEECVPNSYGFAESP